MNLFQNVSLDTRVLKELQELESKLNAAEVYYEALGEILKKAGRL